MMLERKLNSTLLTLFLLTYFVKILNQNYVKTEIRLYPNQILYKSLKIRHKHNMPCFNLISTFF